MNYNQMPQMMNYNNIPMTNIGVPMMNPYQQKLDRYDNLQQSQFSSQNYSQPFLTVANMQEAKEKVINYNTTIFMRDSSEPYLYVKSLDMTGTPTFKVLRVEDVTDQMTNGNIIQQSEQYVSIDKYNRLNDIVTQLQENVNYYISLISNTKENVSQITEPKEPKKTPTSTIKKVGDK